MLLGYSRPSTKADLSHSENCCVWRSHCSGVKVTRVGESSNNLCISNSFCPSARKCARRSTRPSPGGAGFPMQAELTGVDEEAAVQTVFV